MIILYTNDCPKCKVLKSKLESKNIKYETCNNVDEMIQKGFRSMPMLEVDNKVMTFIEANNWINEVTG